MGTFDAEVFVLLAIGVLVIALRTYARLSSVGLRRLQTDDYLMLLAALLYSTETVLTYSVGAYWDGFANNAMTEELRIELDPTSEEYSLRVKGSKAQLAGWSIYVLLLWTLKAAMCCFYIRLTEGLDYTSRIYTGFGLIGATWVAAQLPILLQCRPIEKNWQITPDPGNICQPAVSRINIFLTMSLDVITNIYLLYIPIPILYHASLRPLKKAGLIALFSGGTFVIVASILRSALILSDHVNGARQAGFWACRETFVAIVTSNLPMLIPLCVPVMRSIRRCISKDASNMSNIHGSRRYRQEDKNPRKGLGAKSPYPLPAFTESEERIYATSFGMQAWERSRADSPAWSISVKKEVDIRVETFDQRVSRNLTLEADRVGNTSNHYLKNQSRSKVSCDSPRTPTTKDSKKNNDWSPWSGKS